MSSYPNLQAVLPLIKRYWFLIALLAICLATVADVNGMLRALGGWLKNHRGPEIVVVTIFLFSGFALSPDQLKDGLKDIQGMLLTFVIIFIFAPLTGALFSLISMDSGILIGIFLVAVMPSSLSSGVVMTAAAGGNAAHALVTTIAANALSVFTIPYFLTALLVCIGHSTAVNIDKAAIMLKIGLLVVLPLAAGMLAKHRFSALYRRFAGKISPINQSMILLIVWIAMSQTRGILISSGFTAALIIGLSCVYHGLLLLGAWGLIRFSGRGRGKMESILFIGGQKTLPLSVILQMSLFPQHGVALLVCVLHQVIHLMMDGYLVERLKKA